MQLLSITDPRDNLEKANRDELEKFAKEKGVEEIKEGMPAILMRRILRSRGLVSVTVPNRPLGFYEGGKSYGGEAITDTQINSVNADDALEQGWKKEQEKPVSTPKEMGIRELRSECKRRGIKMARTDNMDTLRAKLNGEQAAN